MFESVHHVAYVVRDMDDAVRTFGERFGLELVERREIGRETRLEMAVFRCGPTRIEVLRPIDHPQLESFLRDRGPGLHHVAYGVSDLPARRRELAEKGVVLGDPFVAPTGWRIAYFDLDRSGLDLFRSGHHGDHLAEETEGE